MRRTITAARSGLAFLSAYERQELLCKPERYLLPLTPFLRDDVDSGEGLIVLLAVGEDDVVDSESVVKARIDAEVDYPLDGEAKPPLTDTGERATIAHGLDRTALDLARGTDTSFT
jgi:hypothetical protein